MLQVLEIKVVIRLSFIMDTLKNLWYRFIYEYCSPSNFDGGFVDFIIVGIATVVVIIAFYQCLKYFIRPGENEGNHIKRIILKDSNLTGKSRLNDRK